MRLVCAIACLLAACSGAAPPPVVEAPPPPVVEAPPPPPPHPDTTLDWPVGTLALEVRPSTSPSWWRPQGMQVSRYGDNLLKDLVWRGVGERTAVFRSARGWVVATIDEGVRGVVQAGDATWVGVTTLGGHDVVIAANREGSLRRASGTDSVEAALAGSFAPLSEIPGATRWDAAGAWVAARVGNAVHLSGDGGATFEVLVPDKRVDTLGFLAVRHDGTVVVQGGDPVRTWVKRPGGKRWKRHRRDETLVRRGAWIMGRRGFTPVLDARWRWSKAPRWWAATHGLGSWYADFRLREGRTWYQAGDRAGRPTVSRPPPVRVEPPEGAVEPSISASVGIAGPHRCRGATCLHTTWHHPLPDSPVRFGLFGDGSCQGAHQDEAGWCLSGVSRVPHVGIVRGEDALRVTSVPAGCAAPGHLLTVGGRGLLLCASGAATDLWLVDPEGRWTPDGRLALPMESLAWRGHRVHIAAASDGTLMIPLACPCEADCAAVVRAPVEAGAAGAWRLAQADGARTWRVTTAGGAVAAVQPDRADPARVRFVLDRPGRPAEPVGAPVALPPDTFATGFVVYEGRLSLRVGKRSSRWHAVGAGGELTAFALPGQGHGHGVGRSQECTQ